MKNTLKFTAILLIMLGCFSSCEKYTPTEYTPTGNDTIIGDTTIENDTIGIVGKWKLVKIKLGWMMGEIDYSQNNIIFKFKTNGILIISGGENELINNGEHEIIIRSLEIGEYTYSIIKNDKYYYLDVKYGLGWQCSISSEELELYHPADCESYYLVKIN